MRLVYRTLGVMDVASYKVNVSLPEDLVSEIDAAASDLGLSRSGFIAEASSRYVADLKNLSAQDLRRKDIDRAIATMRRIGEKLPPGAVQEMIDQTRRDRDRGGRGKSE
ncbi:MAG: type II toxin-antitoxin system HicB family antitoxin [Coriobacteriia bacterium]